jgi:hypothetical protein
LCRCNNQLWKVRELFLFASGWYRVPTLGGVVLMVMAELMMVMEVTVYVQLCLCRCNNQLYEKQRQWCNVKKSRKQTKQTTWGLVYDQAKSIAINRRQGSHNLQIVSGHSIIKISVGKIW